ncbi:MAG: hypothetical protein J6Y94_04365 [Bacteriovoracaceae bacterium]|nr:hypothetical protein [Bacteriovoracaceae bacterium]
MKNLIRWVMVVFIFALALGAFAQSSEPTPPEGIGQEEGKDIDIDACCNKQVNNAARLDPAKGQGDSPPNNADPKQVLKQ